MTTNPSTVADVEWDPISTAPFDRDLELAVFDTAGQVHALVFPCRRILGSWIDAENQETDRRPPHTLARMARPVLMFMPCSTGPNRLSAHQFCFFLSKQPL